MAVVAEAIQINMVTSSAVVAEAMLEDQIADIWPDYVCLYDVRSPEFKNRDLRDRAIQEMAEKLEKTGILNSSNIASFEFEPSTNCLNNRQPVMIFKLNTNVHIPRLLALIPNLIKTHLISL